MFVHMIILMQFYTFFLIYTNELEKSISEFFFYTLA